MIEPEFKVLHKRYDGIVAWFRKSLEMNCKKFLSREALKREIKDLKHSFSIFQEDRRFRKTSQNLFIYILVS
jgi:hypothetical protein